MGRVGEHWFYRSDEEWNALGEQLKRTPCPHCKVVGTLIRHGSLFGFDESSPRKIPRARRVFCSNRNARPGCGRTFSVWIADKIRRLSLTAAGLWCFLQHTIAEGIGAAIRAVRLQDAIAASSGAARRPRSDRTWQRLWQRFDLGQSKIRTALLGRCPPPELPAEPRPAAQALAHLRAAFPDAPCPIAAFQHSLRTFFV